MLVSVLGLGTWGLGPDLCLLGRPLPRLQSRSPTIQKGIFPAWGRTVPLLDPAGVPVFQGENQAAGPKAEGRQALPPDLGVLGAAAWPSGSVAACMARACGQGPACGSSFPDVTAGPHA